MDKNTNDLQAQQNGKKRRKRNPLQRKFRRWKRGLTKKQRRTYLQVKRIVVILLLLFALFLIFTGVKAVVKGVSSLFGGGKKQAEQTAEDTLDTSSISVLQRSLDNENTGEEKEAVELLLSFAGDCTIGTDENFDESNSFNSYYEKEGPAYFFGELFPSLQADDITMINFEGTLTTETTRADKKYAFKADPSYISVLNGEEGSFIEAANVANNHSADYGEKSFTDTLENLQTACITPFGYSQVAILRTKGVNVGFAGIYELEEHEKVSDQVKTCIKALKNAGAQIVIVSFHWGEEKAEAPNKTQVKLAHLAVDEGADLVVGHHPHVLQGTELYKGKSIVYSLGNFCFGGNASPTEYETMLYQQWFRVSADGVVDDTIPDDIGITPCSVSSHTDYNDYRPRILQGEEADAVMTLIQERSAMIPQIKE